MSMTTESRASESAIRALIERWPTGGDTIDGRWEIAHDGETWGHDFDVTYTRL